MGRLLPALAAILLALACSQAATPVVSPPPAQAWPTPAPSTIPLGPPSADILDGPQGGLPPLGGLDHLDLTEAASQQQNQPLALVRYRIWGWVDEATRAWSGPGGSADESLLLLTRADGARLAFGDIVTQKVVPPFAAVSCPATFVLDQCAEGRIAGRSVLVGRVDRYVFTFAGDGVDLEKLAALQAERIRRTG